MKIKVGQKVRIGKSAKCIEALENVYLDREFVTPVLGRTAKVIEILSFSNAPAVHLKFRSAKPIPPGSIKHRSIYWPVSVLRKP